MVHVQMERNGSAAWQAAISISLAYLPFDMAFGMAASEAGLNVVNCVAMSMLVYAASAQMAAVGLFAAGASPPVVIGVTLLLNLRYVLFSAGLSPVVAGWGRGRIALTAFALTDATYGVLAGGVGRHRREAVVVLYLPYLACAVGTWVGASLGAGLPPTQAWGLDYALPAMFIALLVPMVRDVRKAVAGVFAALLCVAFVSAGGGVWCVVVSALVSSLVFVAVPDKLSWSKIS